MPKDSVEKAKEHIQKLSTENKITKKNAELILEYVNTRAAKDISISRQRKYLYALGKLSQIYGKDFNKVTKKEINELAAYVRKTYKGETPRDYLVMLRLFIKYIKTQEGKTYRDNEFPEEVSDIEPGGRKYKKMLPTELLTFDEVKKIAEGAENLRDRLFVLLLYETGCRIGELIGSETQPGLLLKHIEHDKYGSILTVNGKTGSRRIRVVASSPAISNWLQVHPDRDNKNAPLFAGIWTHRGHQIHYRYWNKLLRKVGEKAGVNKPLNPHHLRHSRASELANFMTESQLCNYLGWEQGSRQTRTYVHGKDTDAAILSMYGIDLGIKKQSEFKPVECPRCKTINDPSAKYCSQCSLGLDQQSIMEYDEQKEQLAQSGMILEKAYGKEKLEAMIQEQLLKLLQDNSFKKTLEKQMKK